jgi:hypothetical protein
MNRTQLDSMSREELVERASLLGVRRARILTRPELIDEILVLGAEQKDAASLARSRGLFGRARDLLAKVVERGLHLPDAAERIRTMPITPTTPSRTASSVLPTVTLAEIYPSQGHRGRAIETLKKVIEAEADHADAQALLARLESQDYVSPPPKDLGPEEELPPAQVDADEEPAKPIAAAAAGAQEPVASAPIGPAQASENLMASTDAAGPQVTDMVQPPLISPRPSQLPPPPPPLSFRPPSAADEPTYDACLGIPQGPGVLSVHWTITERMVLHHSERSPGGALSMRVVTVRAAEDGPRASVMDEPLAAARGTRTLISDDSEQVVRRVAVGWLRGGEFFPIAHSPDLVSAGPGAMPRMWTPLGEVRLESPEKDLWSQVH